MKQSFLIHTILLHMYKNLKIFKNSRSILSLYSTFIFLNFSLSQINSQKYIFLKTRIDFTYHKMIPVCFIDSSNSLKNYRLRIGKNSLAIFSSSKCFLNFSSSSYSMHSRIRHNLILFASIVKIHVFSEVSF